MTNLQKTTEKFFKFSGIGNYSEYHNWSSGLDFGEPGAVDDIEEELERFSTQYKGNNPTILYTSTYGGSLEAVILVKAETQEIAKEIAKKWAEKHYPVY
jgi:hypothetical protein